MKTSSQKSKGNKNDIRHRKTTSVASNVLKGPKASALSPSLLFLSLLRVFALRPFTTDFLSCRVRVFVCVCLYFGYSFFFLFFPLNTYIHTCDCVYMYSHSQICCSYTFVMPFLLLKLCFSCACVCVCESLIAVLKSRLQIFTSNLTALISP